jgi:inner membrane protein
VDNITHTLAGAILADAGLGQRTRLGTATLLIGANLPDVDALAYLRDPLVALTVRRGWTHGVLAMAVLPVLLAAAMVAWGRWRKPRRFAETGSVAVADPPLRPREILLLAAIAIWSHPLLDLLNNYGVRLLMPFSGRWFYGDAVFIIDPWLLLILCMGTLFAAGRRNAGRMDAARPARIAGAVALGYIALMIGSGVAARAIATREAAAAGLRFTRAMVAPVPVTPLRRNVIFDLGERYRRGTFDWRTSPHLTLVPDTIPQLFTAPPVAAALESVPAREFLSWSRFPAAVVDSGATPPLVRLYDLRYARPEAPSWAAVELQSAR